jgi:hypothetical protein
MAAARSRAIGLDHRPADVVAAERAEQARKAAAYDAAVSVLEARLGPSWVIGCPTVAEVLVEPHTLRVLLGVPHPGPAASPEYITELREELATSGHVIERLRACEADLARELGGVEGWSEIIARVHGLVSTSALVEDLRSELRASVTAIDDSTPEGVLALLDAAIDALVRDDEAHLAESLIDERDGLAFELGGDLRDEDRFNKRRVDQLAARLGLDKPAKPRSRVETMAADLAERLDSGRLLARILDECAKLPSYLADPELTGHAARSMAERLAASVLALGIVLDRTDKTGGAF